MMTEKRKNMKSPPPKSGDKPRQTCVCNMEWRTNSEGEEWFDCLCVPEEGEKPERR
ncbi:MAG: hypothetical protein ACOY32_15910 [Thermodesulfobacteriota bacterium]